MGTTRMTSLQHLESAIEAARLAYVSLKAAHDAPSEPALRACMGAFATHLGEVQQHLAPVRERLSRDGGPS